MKTRETIVAEINKSNFVQVENIDSPIVIDVENFYIKYPQYEKIEAFGVSLMLHSLKTSSHIDVYQFTNGDIICIGNIFKNMSPICGIGEGLPIPAGFDWNNVEKSSNGLLTKIDEIRL